MINLVGPKTITSLSVDGTDYTVVDGTVAVKPEHVAEFKDFGFGVAPDTQDDPNFAPADDIETMSRNELFAFLKAKGIAVSLPIKNDDLRAIARENSAPAKPVEVDPAKQKAIDDATAAAASAQADLDAAQKAFDAAVDADKDKAQAVLDAAKAAKIEADEVLTAAQA